MRGSAPVAPPAVAEAPVPLVGAANAPVRVEAKLDGASEKSLRFALAQLKADVSPKSIALALNRLANHGRGDVHQTLKAMLGGDTDAVAKFMKNDPLDFARAELKAIARTLGALDAKDIADNAAYLAAGVATGVAPVPAPEAPVRHAFSYSLGQRLGAAIGLALDVVPSLVVAG